MLASCKEQIGRIARHGLGCAHYKADDLRDLARALHGTAFLLGEEADRRDLIANPPAPRAPDAPALGILSGLADYIAKQQAAQTGEPAA